MARRVLFAEVPGFYAAVARADDPSLADRPLLVGGDPRKRGRVQAASREALAAGVTLEMTMIEALRQCPTARAVRTDMARYREVSRRLHTLLRAVEPKIEPFGLGAAYADLAGRSEAAADLANRWREGVSDELGLPLRVGISTSKFLARLAADQIAQDHGVRTSCRPERGGRRSWRPLPSRRGSTAWAARRRPAWPSIGAAHDSGTLRALGRDRLAGGVRRPTGCASTPERRRAMDGRAGARATQPIPKSISREATGGGTSRSDVGATSGISSEGWPISSRSSSRDRSWWLAASRVTRESSASRTKARPRPAAQTLASPVYGRRRAAARGCETAPRRGRQAGDPSRFASTRAPALAAPGAAIRSADRQLSICSPPSERAELA